MQDYFKLPDRPFPSSKISHFQNEAKGKTFFLVQMRFFAWEYNSVFISMALHLASLLKQRLGKFRKLHITNSNTVDTHQWVYA